MEPFSSLVAPTVYLAQMLPTYQTTRSARICRPFSPSTPESAMTALDDAAIETHADEDLTRRVRQYLLMKRLEFREIHIEAEDGEVRLMGEVGSFYLRQLAVSSASRVAGALRIIDLITVPEIAPPRPRKSAK
jgi:hypothetical protein